MADLTIERMSSNALQKLDRLANRQGRSREDVAHEILELALGQDPEVRGAVARRIRSMTPRDIPQSDSTDLIRQIRNE
jgi:hypothetical protein